MAVSVNLDELQNLVLEVANSSKSLNNEIKEMQNNVIRDSSSTNIKSVTNFDNEKSLNKFNESLGKILTGFHDQIIMDLKGIEEGISIVEDNERYIKGKIEEGK